jgi:hypothetical protein
MFLPNITKGGVRRQFLHIDNLDSFTAAAVLGGSGSAALKCWLAVTHRARVTRKTTVKLTTSLCQQFGILNRKAKESGLRHWEALGVFQILRKSGKNPSVTVIGKLGPPLRKTTLIRTTVERLSGEFGNIASFSESPNYAARAIKEVDRKRLEQACLSGEALDIELADLGTGWLIQNIFRADK